MKKLSLANLPTPIQRIDGLMPANGKQLYIKRDDYSGIEFSGNKIRKLEYLMQDALDKGADTIITTGGIQSNHCRATAAACARLGLECYLVLIGDPNKSSNSSNSSEPGGTNVPSDLNNPNISNNPNNPNNPDNPDNHNTLEGNLFLDQFLGARIVPVKNSAEQDLAVEELQEQLNQANKNPYFIPLGASNSLGNLGYRDCFQEILAQEAEEEIHFDTIVIAVGSGGTYAGLWQGNAETQSNKYILGYSVLSPQEEITQTIVDMLRESSPENVDHEKIHISDEEVGEGYGKFTDEDIQFYHEVAKKTGILLDPVYTGKAFKGLYQDWDQIPGENILFIHTGGLFGWTAEMRQGSYYTNK